MLTRRPASLGAAAALALLLACSDASDAEPISSFDAAPATFRPGATVALRPVFTRGSGRVEPDVGPVESGGSYVVGPFTTARTYSLVVTDDGREHRRTLRVPFAYAHAIRPIAASPRARVDHATVRLPDGKVLVAGGRSPGPVGWTDTELFDPATGTFTPSGRLLVTRWNAQMVALPGGDVVIVGGETDSARLEEATAVQRWDAATGTWSIVGHTLEKHVGHTATLVAGGEILVAGGRAARAELFDPWSGESRPPAGAMVHPRFGHTATLLADGRVLLAGGWDASLATKVLEAEVFDPETESFAAVGSLHFERGNHVAQRLPDGEVLVAGGDTGAPLLTTTATAETWDPASGRFTLTGFLAVGRAFATSALLADGSVLVAGGIGPAAETFADVEVFDPVIGEWIRRASLPAPRTGLALVTLPEGRVLITGGSPGDGFPLAAAELYE